MNKLIERKQNGLIKAIIGIRRCGKSFLLFNLFIETYLKDIINRNNLSNKNELDKLVSIITSSIGFLTNPNKLANTFKSVKNINFTAPTISKCLEYLSDSFLIN